MGVFYDPDVTRFSRTTLEGLRRCNDGRNGISLLGGWAVYELVEEGMGHESQDIDLLFHNRAAFEAGVAWLQENGYGWRMFGRSRDNCMVHPTHEHMVVDLFFGPDFGDASIRSLFGTRWMHVMKPRLQYEGFVPSVQATLADKLSTLPRRSRFEKAPKDAIDAGLLLFHNREGIDAADLMTPVVLEAARDAHLTLGRMAADVPERFRNEVEDLATFLDRVIY